MESKTYNPIGAGITFPCPVCGNSATLDMVCAIGNGLPEHQDKFWYEGDCHCGAFHKVEVSAQYFLDKR